MHKSVCQTPTFHIPFSSIYHATKHESNSGNRFLVKTQSHTHVTRSTHALHTRTTHAPNKMFLCVSFYLVMLGFLGCFEATDHNEIAATICKMTSDSMKNGMLVSGQLSNTLSVGKITYFYRLMWCDEEKARDLVALSNEAVFKVNCPTERKMECEKHNIKTHIISATSNKDFTFRDIYELSWLFDRSRAQKMFAEKHTNLRLKTYGQISDSVSAFADVFDSEWKLFSDKDVVQEKAGIASFDPEVMVFAEHQQNRNQILLISDVHTSEKFSDLQQRVISEWKPDDASIEMSLRYWWKRVNNPVFESDHPIFNKMETSCAKATAVCGLFGICTNNKLAKVAAVLGMSATHFAKGFIASTCKRSLHHTNAHSMMKLIPLFDSLEETTNLWFADFDWYFNMLGGYSILEKLEAFDGDNVGQWFFNSLSLEQKDNMRVLSSALYETAHADTLNLNSEIGSIGFHLLGSMSSDNDFICSARSDLMYMSLMSLANFDRSSRRKIVGVYGMAHVNDIKKRLEGNGTNFFMQ